MPTVTELLDRLDNLRKARAAGTHEVRLSDGRTLVYKSDAEMADAAADLERQIAVASGHRHGSREDDRDNRETRVGSSRRRSS